MRAADPTPTDPTDLPEVPAWCASLTPAQYADAVRCAAEAPPLSASQRATLRAIFAAIPDTRTTGRPATSVTGTASPAA